MPTKERLSGNEAVAVAMRQINPGVVAAFPITPSTEIPQYFSSFVNDGMVDTEFIAVESEHSAMSACIGASAAGVRSMTATSSNGLALMWEMLYIAASLRLPIIMSAVNRALSGPININNDHSDTMGARDSGWIQIYGENNQEAYDNFLCAVRIGEHPDIMLPVMNCYDGFITSHAVENIDLLADDEVKNFVGEYRPEHHLLDKNYPVSMGALDLPVHYPEHKKQQADAMRRAKNVILEVSEEFSRLTSRSYGLFEEYQTKDAEIVVVLIGSSAGTAKFVVDNLREKGTKAGVLKIRIYRPFPYEEIAIALSGAKTIAVLDKTDSQNGFGGPLFTDICAALYVAKIQKTIVNYIYGLGGRDVRALDIEKVFSDLLGFALDNEELKTINYLNIGSVD